MFLGNLLPAAFAAWSRWRRVHGVVRQTRRPPVEPSHTDRSSAAALPHGLVAVAPETQAVLAAADAFAHSRFVELQMAVEPDLIAQVDAAEYRIFLRHLLVAAVGRALGSVLVTAMRRADGVEIAVLDDGNAPRGAPRDGSAQPATQPSGHLTTDPPGHHPMTQPPGLPGGAPAVPQGGILTADYQPERGTTIRLRLPRPD